MTQNLSILIAFSGGVLAFFSPCFLPLIPAYLIYISGLSLEEIKKSNRVAVIHALLFILGFTVVFVSLGITASLLGHFFLVYGDTLRIAGGVLVVILGLHLMGALKIPWLNIEKRIIVSTRPAGYLGTIFVGMVFAVGWTPCIGPILAGILVLASQSATVGQGMLLLMTFSLGLGLPLFLVSLLAGYLLLLFKKIEKYLTIIHFISGSLLVIVGVLLMI